MKVLFLSPNRNIVPFLESFGDEIIQTVEPLSERRIEGDLKFDVMLPETEGLLDSVDFIISYGYRHIVCKEIVDRFTPKIINLHISYLPWNRGADPTFWSVAEDTPRGVTIHVMDGSIDTGPVLAQARYEMDIETDTFRTLHRRATNKIEELFEETWQYIRNGEIRAMPQLTYHRVRDKDQYWHLMTKDWDTPIKEIFGIAKER